MSSTLLTDVKIHQAKASTKPIKITNANGLYIEVKPNGSKLWRYRYELNEKENVFAVGEYPEASLKAARAARDSARALVKKGTHPSHARRIELVNTIETGRETFKVVCEEWLGKKKTTWTPRRHIEVSRMLEADQRSAFLPQTTPASDTYDHRDTR